MRACLLSIKRVDLTSNRLSGYTICSIIANGVASSEAIFTGLRVATTLGSISPNNNNNDVIATI